MALTVSEALKLPSLNEALVVAGKKGLSRRISSVTVIEYSENSDLQKQLLIKGKLGEELAITCFAAIRNSIEDQCACIRLLNSIGQSGLLIYYIGLVVPKLDESLIITADELDFPLIVMPENRSDFRYSEVIYDVIRTLEEKRKKQIYIVSDVLENISSLKKEQRISDNVLRIISNRIQCSLALLTKNFDGVYAYASWPMSASALIVKIQNAYKEKSLKIGENEVYNINGQNIYTITERVSFKSVDFQYIMISSMHGPVNYNIMEQINDILKIYNSIWGKSSTSSGDYEIINAILSNEVLKLRQLEEILTIDVSQMKNMWVVNFSEHISKKEIDSLTENIVKFLNIYKFKYICSEYMEKIVIFFESDSFHTELNNFAEMLIKDFQNVNKVPIILFTSEVDGTKDAKECFMLLEETIKPALLIYPRKYILNRSEIMFTYKCMKKIESNEENENLTEMIASLVNEGEDNCNTLIETLAVFLLDASQNMSQTAKQLFVHLNTVKYRINKASAALKFQIGKMPETFDLYTELAILRLLGKS
ncbi:PucR family transcriptional regulator [Anaeropeptidivorans aminofermentans]|uniref:PucR family transcriptional regulator n=1 Tax=Anaeropeptidivorans aminofermentans TaxID=2934315 RepID=UPI000EB94223|nr:PucR family transcriptional regulator [Anaeropeptidivorans aminofermentans]HAQ40893.1 hypothetical protein [Clostridiales bacterium]